MNFSEGQLERYSRQILLPEIGGRGQRRLLEARIVVMGVGVIGRIMALYLAGAGVGWLRFMVPRGVEESGEGLVESLVDLNPDVQVELVTEPVDSEELALLLEEGDLILDVSNTIAVRQRLNRLSLTLKKPLLSGWILGGRGYVATSLAGILEGAPCLECHLSQEQKEPFVLAPELLRVLPGLLGTILATELLLTLLNLGPTTAHTTWIGSPWEGEYHRVPVYKNRVCACCGKENLA
ncbi:MAG: ThiF family adenylyltransferase [Magnetococcus sp. DMHC-6]